MKFCIGNLDWHQFMVVEEDIVYLSNNKSIVTTFDNEKTANDVIDMYSIVGYNTAELSVIDYDKIPDIDPNYN